MVCIQHSWARVRVQATVRVIRALNIIEVRVRLESRLKQPRAWAKGLGQGLGSPSRDSSFFSELWVHCGGMKWVCSGQTREHEIRIETSMIIRLGWLMMSGAGGVMQDEMPQQHMGTTCLSSRCCTS